MITRRKFVELCTQAIVEVREEVTVVNQLSGNEEYQREEDNYLRKVRANHMNYIDKNGYCPVLAGSLATYMGIGRCLELSDALLAKLIKALNLLDINARIRAVASDTIDHGYLHIRIHLKNERSASLWEVDAWDPRVIDVSQGPNQRIKNESLLFYGSNPSIDFACFTQEYKIKKNRYSFHFAKPVKGKLPGDVSSARGKIYPDYTIQDAYATGLLAEGGELMSAQRASSWQIGK